MNTKIMRNIVATALTASVALANAAETPIEATGEAPSEVLVPQESPRMWRLSLGWTMNGPIGSNLRGRNLPVPKSGFSSTLPTKSEALAKSVTNPFGDGYIGDSNDGWGTRNWQLPESALQEDWTFDFHNRYEQVDSTRISSGWTDSSSDCCQHSISLELSREIWSHNEAFEHRWGIDLAFDISYFFGRDIYSASGYTRRDEVIGSGDIQSSVNDYDAMDAYMNGYDSPVMGMYGHGAFYDDFSPMILFENVVWPHDVPGASRSISSCNRYSASGDYRELEMLLMFRPWYEITDWWRVYGEIGLGVSWGNFESDFTGGGMSYSEDFSKWDCYGVAGLGTMFRYGMFDLSLDFLGRFLRDDMDIDGRYVNGSIRRADWCFRVMVGVEF